MVIFQSELLVYQSFLFYFGVKTTISQLPEKSGWKNYGLW